MKIRLQFDRGSRFSGAFIALLLTVGAANAQLLDLPEARLAPALESPTASQQIIGELQAEIEALADRERGAPEAVRVIFRTLINLRILAAELLEVGDRAGHEGSVAVVMGLTIATEREGMDRLLLGELAPKLREPDQNDDADVDGDSPSNGAGRGDDASPAMTPSLDPDMISALHAFNERIIDHAELARTADPYALDEALRFLLAPLAEAIMRRTGGEIVNHWPIVNGASGRPNAIAEDDVDLRAAIESIVEDEDARATALLIIDRVERGLDIPAYRTEAKLLRRRLGRIVDAIRAIDEFGEAIGLPSEMRARLGHVLRRALADLADPATRPQAEAWTQELEAAARLAERVHQLRAARRDVRPIVDAWLRLEASARPANSPDETQDAKPDAPPPAMRLDRLHDAVEPLALLDQIDRAAIPRWLRPTAQQLVRAARIAARRFDDAMNDLETAADFTSDPGVVAGMRELDRLVQALRWMREAESWEAAIIRFAPHRRDQFREQLRQWFDDLLDAGRAQRAMDRLRRLDREIARFVVLPFEDDLRQPTPNAIELTGGLNEDLSNIIHELRRDWAEAWSAGEPNDETTANLDLAHRLLAFLDGSETILALRETTRAPLERWSAWAMPPQHMRRLVGDVPSRLKLACGAAARGRANMLERQLDQMERQAPVAWLIAHSSIAMEDELAALPDGAPGLLGQLMYGPSEHAWLADERMSIAHVCRYALEAEFANRIDRGGLAGELNRYVSGLAADLLRQIDETR